MILADAPQQLPESWIGLVGIVVIMAFQGIQTWQAKRIKDSAGKTEAQVTNGGTNLAATVGEVKSMLADQREDVAGIRKDIGGIRGEIRDERQARVDLARTLESRLKHLERRSG